MSFTPLPAIFRKDLRGARAAIVEVGCGDGRFSAELRRFGVDTVKVDRRPPSAGTVADLVADAGALPFAAATVGVLVVANLLRHLWPIADGADGKRCAVPEGWVDCLRPGGSLYIFEDEAEAGDDGGEVDPAVRNYRRLQDFLARLVPGRRPLLSADSFRRRATASDWSFGAGENHYAMDRDAVLDFLRRGRPRRGSEADGLCRAIEEDGIGCGGFWWARLTREGA